MAKKMLIDASHPEETRVVVVSGNRIEEFDFESAARKQLKGNIYLAKITRVEPSLQAAFVEYGGNRHGFLAFSEIHPDYYQIPVADRERLLRQEAEESRRLDEAVDAEDGDTGRGRSGPRRGGRRRRRPAGQARAAAQARTVPVVDPADPLAFAELHLAHRIDPETVAEPDDDAARSASQGDGESETDRNGNGESERDDDWAAGDGGSDGADDAPFDEEPGGEALLRSRPDWVLTGEDASEANTEFDETGGPGAAEASGESGGAAGTDSEAAETGDPDSPGEGEAEGDDADAETTTINELTADEEAREELARRPRVRLRDYKIQEVIKRRQIMLVQVVKEERGNKGAALTTYLSLAGRYCVLMPNTPRGGGISRKITNAADRKRLKAIASELEVPEGMGLIIRTAGANRTKAEIRRDYEYLLRLWESVRELTLQSTAPCLVYEEGSLIKRSIRDLYSREIDTVQVEGEEAYKEAKAFMRMLMPSHAKNVQSYKDRIPLFQRYQVEQQLDAMLTPQVQLPSGGYIVLNPTEALVAIDVNSGKSTREHNIEDTALRTNLEAAEEIARQLRLRDLAGLIVIDFIDMEEPRNNRAVERKLKDCLKQDRARIQTGRISMFGLLEMSRQRLRPGMMEISTVTCDHCQGTGVVRSVESAALRILRACDEEGLRQRTADLTVPCAPDVANYLLNYKRHQLMEIEQRYGVTVFIEADAAAGRDFFEIRRGEPMSESRRRTLNEQAIRLESAFGAGENRTAAEAEEPGEVEEIEPAEVEKPKQRRGGRKKRKAGEAETAAASAPEAEETRPERRVAGEGEEADEPRRRRRRGKRGGRRHRKQREDTAPVPAQAAEEGEVPAGASAASAPHDEAPALPFVTAEPDVVSAGEGDKGFEEGESSRFEPAPRSASREAVAAQADAGPEPAFFRPAAPEASVTAPIFEEEDHAAAGQPERTFAGNGHEPGEEARAGPRTADEKAGPARTRAGKAAARREPASRKGEPAEAVGMSKPGEPARRGWWQRRIP